jgi:hypothetical protein
VGAGRPGGLCGGVPRGRAVALRERGVVLRERGSERAEESRPELARCRSQKTDQQHDKW